MNFGNNLKDLRETRNVTQGQLAEYLQVSRPTIAGYETKSRQPDFEKLEKLANYFHVSIDYLVSGSETTSTDIPLKKEPNEKSLDRDVEFPIVKDTTPNMMNPRLYTTSYNKPQGQQFDDTAVLSFIKLQYT